jgi:S1-C subfamily serine protease
MAINIARRKVIAALGGTAVAWPLTWPRAACARQPERMRRNGVLMPFSADQEVTAVDPSAAAAPPDKRLSPGDVIVEVQYRSVGNPADLQNRVDQLKEQGEKVAVLLVSNADAETRFVALSLQ